MKNYTITSNNFKPIAHSAIILGLSALMCVLFTVFNPPVFHIEEVEAIASRVSFSPERLSYWWRFSLSLVLFGVIPLLTSWLLGLSRHQLGLTSGIGFMKKPLFLLSLPVALLIGASGGASPALYSYYPYARDLSEIVRQQGMIHLIGHLGAYFFLYYLPWEFFFRGFLLMPFAMAARSLFDRHQPDSVQRQAGLFLLSAAILFQTIPSTMLHFGHPFFELLSAIPAGLLFGYIAYASRSIVPALLLHALVGFGTDGYIIFHSIGVF
jgi:membrane protease YdiL (CAAX protease family)